MNATVPIKYINLYILVVDIFDILVNLTFSNFKYFFCVYYVASTGNIFLLSIVSRQALYASA